MRLKEEALSADSPRMFFSQVSAPALTPAQLRSLRCSLNEPLLEAQDLPRGPARAAVVVHEASKGLQLTIAIRSMRTGETVVYGFPDALEGERAQAAALEAALSFCESLGFLFDDEELDPANGAVNPQAFERWREHVGPLGGEPETPLGEELFDPSPEPAAGEEVASAGQELLLEEALEPVPLRGPSLTKFRGSIPAGAPNAKTSPVAPNAAASPAEVVLVTPHGPAVGKVSLVKQRLASEVSIAKVVLLRLLGAF